MHSDVSLARFKQFPRLMWILLFGSFITRGSYYMVWPFLAVILYEKFALTATEVGLVLSSAAIISVFTSFMGSALSDRIGRHKLMYLTGVLYIISFSLLAQVDSVKGYVVVMTLCSIATSLWRPLTSATIGDIIDDPKTRELAMQSLYFVVNVGCAVGPMLGVWLGLTGKQSSFYITAAAFAALLGLLFWGFRHQACQTIPSTTEQVPDELIPAFISRQQIITILQQDKLLQCLIVANILCMFIYAQMDSSLIQYLTRANAPNLLTLISAMIFTNALVIISTQFLLLRLMAGYSLVHRIQFGLILLVCSQVWLAYNPIDLFWGWIGAVIVISLAETILFPTMNVHIDRLAPKHLRGAYFGAASFYEIGFAFAPLGGGIILDHLGGYWLFIIGAILSLVVMYLYSILDKLPRPDFAAMKLS
ncbi:MFS transporter [Shewanella psychromarinicola]|uniref:MFS transporter n=1 Tax=Shewanella psychromarinicola TaxID=2487742 RepID=A0A3N4ED08_9GAMM|nr:MFS transporter [Shewanella psychromarinicola]AZG37313.1 MFS transporter [Shewanella psychromarinicola]MCL1083713.1 MFS transporter [Shewanella psychromarinicola]RPA27484.1 MFS transporter [Shewanella psychromarinicola]